MPFFFPKTIAERAMSTYRLLYKDKDLAPSQIVAEYKDTEISFEVYDFLCQKYGGLGYISSFIPGRQAFIARRVLSGSVDKLATSLINEIKPRLDFSNLDKTIGILAIRGGVLESALLLPLIIWRDVIEPYRAEFHMTNSKKSLKRIVSYFPLLKDICEVDGKTKMHFRENALGELIHTLCNPIRLIEDSLFFLHQAINRVIEIGSTKKSNSGPIRKTFKGFVGVVFSAINIPVKILSAITDIPYRVLKNGIYDPIKFVVTALSKNENLNLIILKENDQEIINRLAIGNQNKLEASAQKTVQSTGKILQFVQNPVPAPIEESHSPIKITKLGQSKFILYAGTPSDIKLVSQLASIAHDKRLDDAAKDIAANRLLGRQV